MAGPLAILGVIGTAIAACFLRDRGDSQRTIPDTGPVPPESPEDGSIARQAFLELKGLFQGSYLADDRKQELSVQDAARLERFQAKFKELQERAYEDPKAAIAYDTRAFRIFHAIANSSEARDRYFKHSLLLREKFEVGEIERAVDAMLNDCLDKRISLDAPRLNLGRVLGMEISEPVVQRLVAKRIKEADSRLLLKAIEEMEGWKPSDLEDLGALARELNENSDPLVKDLSIALSWFAAARGSFSVDYFRRTFARGGETSLPLPALRRSLEMVRLSEDPFDDARLFHRCEEEFEGEVGRLAGLTEDQVNEAAHFTKSITLQSCLFQDPKLSPQKLAGVGAWWSVRASNLRQTLSERGRAKFLGASRFQEIGEFQPWADATATPLIQSKITMGDFMRKHVLGVAVGKGEFGDHEGMANPILQLVYLNRETLDEFASSPTLKSFLYLGTLFHEAYHNHHFAEIESVRREGRYPPLLDERNAMVFGKACLQRLLEDQPKLAEIVETKKILWALQLYIRASNVSLGLDEVDESLREALPKPLERRVANAYPVDLAPEYLDRLGISQSEYFRAEGRPTLNTLKR